MNKIKSDFPLIIIGAGAAGLGASQQASVQETKHIVLEASHRTGGRGLTERLEGNIPVDLGCHWLHSASKNPYVAWADKLGFDYDNDPERYEFAMYFRGHWLSSEKFSQYDPFMKQCYSNMEQIYTHSPHAQALDGVDDKSEWAQHFYYWMSLMHSVDLDQVTVQDVLEYNDTYEDWPVKQGYGTLIAKQGENCPVQLNTMVESIKWNTCPIKITTNKGGVSADKVIIAVSTGVLGAEQITFSPKLPTRKLESINALPLGNSNRLFFSIEEDTFDQDVPERIHFEEGDISMSLEVQPFDIPGISTSTGGRFAWWLEKQGVGASKQYLTDALIRIFGGEIRGKLKEFKVSAWGHDPLIRGAYSAQTPGNCDMRGKLAEPIDECLYFAGEATSMNFFNTAHGAYLSGIRAATEVNMRR